MLSDLHAFRDELTDRFEGRFEQLETQITGITSTTIKLQTMIAEEGETTRRHFNIMVEKVEAAVKIVAEANSHHAVVLDDHETRLKQIEKTR